MFDINDYDFSSDDENKDYSYLDNQQTPSFITNILSNGDVEETTTFTFNINEIMNRMENMIFISMLRSFARVFLNDPNNPQRSTTVGGATEEEINNFVDRLRHIIDNNEDDELNRLFEQFKKEGPPPAPEESLNNLKLIDVKEFSEFHKNECNSLCSICQSDLIDTEDKICCLPCKHYFHNECVIQWLKIHGICPLCRNKI